MKIFFFPFSNKGVKWSTSVAHSFTQTEQQQQNEKQKPCTEESSLDIILMGLRWNEMEDLGLLVKTLPSKVFIYISCLYSEAFNTTTRGSPHSSVNRCLRAFPAFSYTSQPVAGVLLTGLCHLRCLDVFFSPQTLALKSAVGLFYRTEEENNSYLKFSKWSKY